MATSYKNIYLKSTYIPDKIPSDSEIAYRELFLNVADGKLYFKNTNNDIIFCLTNQDLTSIALIDENNTLVNTISWSNIINLPTTLAEYGIIDAAPLVHNHDNLYLSSLTANSLYSPINHTHNTYQSVSEKGVPNGYASLDAHGIVLISQLPEALGGEISSVTITDISTSGTYYPVFVHNISGNQPGNISSNKLHFNPDTGTLTCTTINANATTATKLLNPKTINGVNFDGSANITIAALTPTLLFAGEGIVPFIFNGSQSQIVSINAAIVALKADVHYIGTTSIALNRASANLALTGISSVTLPGATSGSVQIIPAAVAGTNTVLTLPATSGTIITSGNSGIISNMMLTNSSLTIGSALISLGDTVTTIAGLTSITSTTFVGTLTGNAATATKLANARTINGISFDGTANIIIPSTTANSLTIGTGLLGLSFNGSAAVTIAIDSTVALRADTHYIGTTAVALNRASANIALTGISSITLPGMVSGAIQIIPSVVAGTGTTLSLPATTGTVITSGDIGTVTNTMLAGSIANAKLANSSITIGSTSVSLGASTTTIAGLTSVTSTTFVGALTGNASTATTLATARTINGISFDGSANIIIPSTTANSLTIGSGLSGTSFNGSAAVTIAIDSTVALKTDTHYIGTTSVALNRASASLALTGISSIILPGATSGTIQIIPTAVAGTSTVFTLPAVTGTAITTGDTGTVTNTMLAGSIATSKLVSNAVTVGSTTIFLGSSATTIVGLVSVTSTTFVGALTGNASTATSAATLTTARTINGTSFNGSANITITANTTNSLTIGSGLSGTSFNGSAAVTIAVDSTVALRADTHYIGTTSVALNRASTNLALTGISSVTLPGATSGTIQIAPAAVAGTGTVFTLPAVTGTAITTGDTGTVTNTMLAGSIATSKLANSSVTVGSTAISLGAAATTITGLTSITSTTFVGSLTGNASTATTLATARTINGVSFDGSSNITIPSTTANSLTIGSGLSGTSFNGSLAVTIAIDSTVALRADTHYIGTTSVALNRASANLALTGISSIILPGATSGTVQIIPTAVAGTGTVFTLPAVTGTAITTGDTATVTNTMLAGSIANAKLANSSVTIGSTGISLGGTATTITGLTSVTSTTFVGALTGNASTATTLATARTINNVSFNGSANITITANTSNALTIGSGLSGTSFNGSTGITIAIDSTVALRADTHYIGTTSVALNRASANLALTGISSVTLPGATSGTIQIVPAAVAGTGTIFTLPAVTGTAITTGDIDTVTNTMLVNSTVTVGSTAISLGAAATTITGLTSVTSTTFVGALTGNASTATSAATLTTARTINNVSFNGSTNITITANTSNALTIGTGLSGTSFNGSTGITIAIDSTVALRADTHYIGTTSVALNRASANLALTGISSVTLPGATSGTIQIVPAAVAGTGTVFTLPAVTGTAITTGDTATVTNTMLAGSIANAKLTNSSVTVGSTAISLGAAATTIAGLTSVTSTTFVGALTGNASTATTLATARTINGISFNGSANITVPPTFAIAETCLNGGIDLTINTKAYVHIPSTYNGWSLVDVIAVCKTGSTSGTPTFTVMKYAINSGTAVNMLTTNLTIDINELNSITAAVPVVINNTNKTVATGDYIEINCTSAGTGVTYTNIQLKFSSS